MKKNLINFLNLKSVLLKSIVRRNSINCADVEMYIHYYD